MPLTAPRLRLLGASSARSPRFVGRSLEVARLLEAADRLAATELSLLLLGESGSGKEVLARRIHASSSRAERPLVSENCAAVPSALFEAEFFGAVRGAYTGADRDRPGLLARAHGGTLLLDEVGDMPLAAQAKVLRVLEERTARPVGGTKERPVDVRILCATHRDLPAMVRAGTFREDLYYRLCGATLRIPALRERPGDVPDLVAHFLAGLNHEHGARKTVTPEWVDALVQHDWPGNVRELQNQVKRAFFLSDGDVLRLEDLDLGPIGAPMPVDRLVTAVRPMAEIEEDAMRLALEVSDGHRDAAAKALGISRAAFYAKMKRYGIEVRSSRDRSGRAGSRES